MNLAEAQKELGISRATLYNYRKKLGIVEETKSEVTLKQLEQMRKLADSRVKYSTNRKKKEQEIIEKAEELKLDDGFLSLLPSDSIQVTNLKRQYNVNQRLINFLDKQIRLDIQAMVVPEKAVSDMMTSYQNTNMKIIKQLEAMNPEEDELVAKINAKLSSYS